MSEDQPGPPAPDEVELEQLRQENEELRAEVAAAAPRTSKRRFRRSVAAVLAFLSALLLVLGIVAGWTSSTALNTQKFVSRVGPIIDEPAVRTAISTELGNELVSVLDLQQRIQPALPPNLTFLAGPIAAGAESFVRKQVTSFVGSDAFHRIWYAALTLSQEQVARLLTGSNAAVTFINGKLYINLISVIDQVLSNLSAQLPTVFGNAVALKIPDNLPVDQIRAIVQKYLGVQLPANFAQIPVMDASALDAARTGVKVVNVSVILVLVLALVALVVALWASTNRRRTLLQVGLWLAGITAVVFFTARAVSNSTLAGVSDPVLRPAVTSAVHVIFSSLRGWAALLFWVGLVLGAVMYLVGPGRFPVWLRAKVGIGVRWVRGRVAEIRADEGLASWTARHLDVLRIGGAVLAALLLLFLASWLAFVVIGVLLVLFEVGVTLYARSTPQAGEEVDAAEDGAQEPVGGPR
jgi:hypothetical protein